MQSTYDAIVVGSGISGGWAAKELTEKGLRVLLLERGRNVEHIKDYVNATKAPWEYLHRGGRTKAMEEVYPVLKRDYPLNEKNLAFWVNDKESPYTEVKRFDWYRGYQVGGRSLMWGRQSYRWSDFDFDANAKDGIAIDWPIRYADLAPWYDHVERHAGISGSHEGMPQLPDGQFQPAMPLNCGEELVAGKLKNGFDGKRHIILGRTANATKALEGRAPCQYRNACWLGCPYGAYFSTQSSTLPAAVKTGKLTLKPWSIVTESSLRQEHKRATGVRVLDADHEADDRLHGEGHLPLRVDAQLDVAAHALGHRRLARRTRQQLRRARPQPHGSSLPLRRGWNLEGMDDKYYYGRRPNRLLHPALSQPVRRQARLPARLRLSGQRGPRRLVARGEGARHRRGVQGRDGHAGPVDDRRHGVRRDAAESRQHASRSTRRRRTSGGLPVLKIDCATGENEAAGCART